MLWGALAVRPTQAPHIAAPSWALFLSQQAGINRRTQCVETFLKKIGFHLNWESMLEEQASVPDGSQGACRRASHQTNKRACVLARERVSK